MTCSRAWGVSGGKQIRARLKFPFRLEANNESRMGLKGRRRREIKSNKSYVCEASRSRRRCRGVLANYHVVYNFFP